MDNFSFVSNLVPFNMDGGQKMLVSAPAGTGKTNYLYSVVERAVGKGKSVSVLNVDERESEMDEYRQLGATVWGCPSSDRADFDGLLEEIRSYIDLIRCDDPNIVIIDSLTGLYDIMDMSAEFADLMEGKPSKKGGYNPYIQKAIRGILNNFFDSGRRTVVGSIITNDGRDDQVRLFQDLAKDCNAELHLSKKLAELGLFPAVNFRKSYARNYESFVSKEHAADIKEMKALLSLVSDGEAVAVFYDLKVLPNIRL